MSTPGLQLHSTVQKSGELTLSLAEVPTPAPREHEVVVRIEAAPINPSDLWLMLAGADFTDAKVSGTAERPVVTAKVPDPILRMMGARLGQPMPVGNEASGVVVETGASPAAKALQGKKVALLGGAMYSQYRTVPAEQCLTLSDETTAAEGASAFVNPLTALSMLEVMRLEKHTALVHTAAAGSLGQMLVRICLEDKVELVNIVRKPEQEKLLRGLGAKHVVSSDSPTFMKDLIAAVSATGATLAFDAIGGGKLANQILTAMEISASAKETKYSRYGSSVHKQVYIYGNLDRGPTELSRSFGLAWSVGGWLVTPFLQKLGVEANVRLRSRVVAGLKTTFASSYVGELSLAEALSPAAIAKYGAASTGQKYLIAPNRR